MRQKREENARLIEKNASKKKRAVRGDLNSVSPMGKFTEQEVVTRFFRIEQLDTGANRNSEKQLSNKRNIENLNHRLVFKSNRVMHKWKNEREFETNIQQILISLTKSVRLQKELLTKYGERLVEFIDWLNSQPLEFKKRINLPKIP